MSHVATIELEVKDIDALAEACPAIGGEFMRDQKSYRWWGSDHPDRIDGDAPPEGFTVADLGHCEHAIRLKGQRYEIGVAKRRDGRPGYVLLFDDLYGELATHVGPNCNRLKQEYALSVAKRQARKQGFSVVGVQTLANGTKQLKLSK
jgi:hypothetical protein